MSIQSELWISDTKRDTKVLFEPIDPLHVKMYLCGPTVYAPPHIGNMRSAVTFDVLYRLLLLLYPQVTYARNLTDIDDKIINAAKVRNITAKELSNEMETQYHADTAALNCLPPTIEPRATEHLPHMFDMINKLILQGHAYVAEQHVLFDVNSHDRYGELSRRSQDEMIAGARVEVAPYKRHPADFVLWKPADDEDYDFSFESPWGRGRPGWHIECSAMSTHYLGQDFDLHCGGIDLLFPHHENECAQSICANDGSDFAKYWVHNGFLTIANRKMSKTIGNIATVQSLLEQGIPGCALRYFYFTAHYHKPLNYCDKAISDAVKAVKYLGKKLLNTNTAIDSKVCNIDDVALDILCDDLNTPKLLAYMYELANRNTDYDLKTLNTICNLIGLDVDEMRALAVQDEFANQQNEGEISQVTLDLLRKRAEAKDRRDWRAADQLRAQIEELGYEVRDNPDGSSALAKKINE